MNGNNKNHISLFKLLEGPISINYKENYADKIVSSVIDSSLHNCECPYPPNNLVSLNKPSRSLLETTSTLGN